MRSGNILGVSSGTATITVKSTNNVSNSIQIKVYSPVTDIYLDAKSATLQIGETFKINAIIYPEDASNKNIIFSSNNETVAKVDQTGNVQAIKQGTATISAKTEDENKEAKIEINVIPKLEDLDIIFKEPIKINANELSGLDYKNNTAKYLQEKIKTKYNIEIYNNKGEAISEEKLIGTGSTVKIIDEENNTIVELIAILYGDVNGDGKINSIDLLVLQRHILEIEKFNGIFLKAGNINKNGKNPSSLDSLIIQRHILGIKIIEQ